MGGYPPGGGYGAYGGYGGYQPPREHPRGTVVLVLAILSVVGLACCQLLCLLAPVAWILGSSVLKEIDANPAAYTNRGVVQAGRIIGIIITALTVVGILIYAGIFIAAAASSNSGY